MSANKLQVAGCHYKDKAIQPWDFIAGNKLGYFEGNIVKFRAGATKAALKTYAKHVTT